MGKNFEDSFKELAKEGKDLAAALAEARKAKPDQTTVNADDLIRAKGPGILAKVPGHIAPANATPDQIVALVRGDSFASMAVDNEFGKLERHTPAKDVAGHRIAVSDAVRDRLAEMEAKFPEQMAALRKNAKVEVADEKTNPVETLDKLRAAMKAEKKPDDQAPTPPASPSPAMVR